MVNGGMEREEKEIVEKIRIQGLKNVCGEIRIDSRWTYPKLMAKMRKSERIVLFEIKDITPHRIRKRVNR